VGGGRSAEKVAATERELNEFLTILSQRHHLAFGPDLSINETHISNEEFKTSLQEDAEIIGSSLHFIDEFLRSMLDTYLRPTSSIKLAPTDLLKDVLEPVQLYQRDGGVDVTVDCPKNLIIATDCCA
jgi:hypothetical protein